jgi:hypothetical protein
LPLVALAGGDIGFLWRLALFFEADECVAATWPNVLALKVTFAQITGTAIGIKC